MKSKGNIFFVIGSLLLISGIGYALYVFKKQKAESKEITQEDVDKAYELNPLFKDLKDNFAYIRWVKFKDGSLALQLFIDDQKKYLIYYNNGRVAQFTYPDKKLLRKGSFTDADYINWDDGTKQKIKSSK